MNQILEILDDIKQNITDKQYKTIMDSLNDIYENKKILYPHHYQEIILFVY